MFFFFSSRRRHTRLTCDWSSDVCSSDLDPLVRLKARYGEVEVLLLVPRRKAGDVDRRVENLGLPPVCLPDALRDVSRVCEEHVDAVRAAHVPLPQAMQREARAPAHWAAVESRGAQVFVLQIPRIAHRRMHVAQMKLARP